MKYIKTFEQLGAKHVNNNDAGDNYWGNSASGALIINKENNKILVGLRSEDVNEPNEWSSFGGAIEDELSPEYNAKHEIYEETGYKGEIELIPAYIFKTPSGSFTYYNFIGLVETEFVPILDWENSDYRWITLQELYDLKPKHFGLEALIKNSGDIIRKYAK